ncbi:HTH-type transcriptional regulator IscR [Commensalibacter sp. Nvir]|uniref:RrF2 family transcriptional regulator n=1 Tax=Commensalibacter sp. Nvir TaxID=3069817 RepID=UPI002D3C8BA4|nr:HTH-type transcriptional regulator IscR [Commensalibacter sp. Nvir]
MVLRQDRAIIAVLIMTDVAFYSNRNHAINAADISQRTNLPKRSIEPILQLLSKAKILTSIRGPHGGYHLSRPKRLITVADIIQAITLEEKEKYQEISSVLHLQVIKPFWEKIDQKILTEFSKTTLQDLTKTAEQKGIKKPKPTAIHFFI